MAAVDQPDPAQPTVKVVRFRSPVKVMVRVKNPAAVALGKLGGSKGGKIRAARLSPEQRTAIAAQAARARWAKEKAD
jgi:hypothetical protein